MCCIRMHQITGTRILSTCQDNRLRVWDSVFCDLQHPSSTIVHSHDFNRYLSPFKAHWDPKVRASLFVLRFYLNLRLIVPTSPESSPHPPPLPRSPHILPHSPVLPTSSPTPPSSPHPPPLPRPPHILPHSPVLPTSSPTPPSSPHPLTGRVVDDAERVVVCGRYISDDYNGVALHPIDFLDASSGALLGSAVDPHLTTISPVNLPHPRCDLLATGSS
ncbi:unnamed protein product, partial [Closterium sp. NIES-54]